MFANSSSTKIIRQVAVIAVVPGVETQFLLIRRFASASYGPIKGTIEPGETFEQTARREALEEAGAELGALLKIGGYDYFKPYAGKLARCDVIVLVGQVIRLRERFREQQFRERRICSSREEAVNLLEYGSPLRWFLWRAN